MTDRSEETVTQGSVEANGLTFAYLAAGDAGAPLAPWLRGYAPTTVPDGGHYQSAVIGLDACALHRALGGDDEAVLIGHDWGALAAYSAVHHPDTRWRRLVAMAVPPPQKAL